MLPDNGDGQPTETASIVALRFLKLTKRRRRAYELDYLHRWSSRGCAFHFEFLRTPLRQNGVGTGRNLSLQRSSSRETDPEAQIAGSSRILRFGCCRHRPSS
jgi:hypothetical protein